MLAYDLFCMYHLNEPRPRGEDSFVNGDHSDSVIIKERQQLGQFYYLISYIQSYSVFITCHFIIYIYIINCRIAVLLFFEIVVSRFAVSVSPYPSRRIGAS